MDKCAGEQKSVHQNIARKIIANPNLKGWARLARLKRNAKLGDVQTGNAQRYHTVCVTLLNSFASCYAQLLPGQLCKHNGDCLSNRCSGGKRCIAKREREFCKHNNECFSGWCLTHQYPSFCYHQTNGNPCE